MTGSGADYLEFADAAEWRAWLQAHHAVHPGVRLLIYKTRYRDRGLTLDPAVEEALCFGWIDGGVRSRDEKTFTLRFTPRRPRSVWSPRNVERVERLIREGRMTEAGLGKVMEAKKDGRWEAALLQDDLDAIPQSLRKALSRRKGALAGFRALTPSRRKQLLYWVRTARRPQTEEKRIRAILAEVLGE